MPVWLNYLIVHARYSQASARFLAGLLGLPESVRFGPFLVVATESGVSLDSIDTVGKVSRPHYAFLISAPEFGEINHGDGVRGVYFEDPDGHLLEVLTRHYGNDGGV